MQILSCSSALGNCCNDPGIAIMIDSIRRVVGLIQLVIPIILIVWSGFQLMKLMMDPDQKGGTKKIINKFIAAAIVFFIPSLLNVVLGMMPQSFQVASCWKAASNKSETLKSRTATYIPIEKSKKYKLPNPNDYEKGVKKEPYNPSSTTGGNAATGSTWSGGTVTGEDIIAYARQFIGKGYRLGCHWNGEIPYSPASCIGFIVGVYKHFGIKVHCTEDYSKFLNNPSKYTVVTNAPHRPGDIVIYDGHFAMLTGNGNEIIHSISSSNVGPTYSKNYKKSSMKLLGIVRVNGVK